MHGLASHPWVLLGDALVVAPLVAQPLLVELPALVFVSDTAHTVLVVLAGFWRQRSVLKVTLDQGDSLVWEIARLVLPKEKIHAGLHVPPVDCSIKPLSWMYLGM